MKSVRDGFSRFHLLRLWWQSTTALLFLVTLAAHAQTTRLWTGNSGPNWNNPFNWSPLPTVPTGTATFGQSPQTMVTSLLPSTIGTIQFNQGAPAYTISPFLPFAINGSGIVNNSSNPQTFNVGFLLQFFNASTASREGVRESSLRCANDLSYATFDLRPSGYGPGMGGTSSLFRLLDWYRPV